MALTDRELKLQENAKLFQRALEYSTQNPESDTAYRFRREIESGMHNPTINYIKKTRDVSYVPEEKRGVREKILGFTGGEEIAQGLGQALANPGISKNIDKAQEIQFKTQGDLIQRIKEKKARGEDTTRLEKALEEQGIRIDQLGDGTEKLLNQKELTNKEVIGDAIQLGTTAAAGEIAKGASKIVSKIPVIGQGAGIVKGAARGALSGGGSGAVIGAAEGAANEIQDQGEYGAKELDKSSVLKSALGGATVGLVAGGAIGIIGGGVAGGVAAHKEKVANRALDAITPKVKNMTPKEYEKLVNAGKIQPKTATEPAKYVLSDDEIATARKYEHLLTHKDPVRNTKNVIEEIAGQDKAVGTFLKQHNGIYNNGELKNYILKDIDDVTDIMIDDARLATKKQLMVDNFLKSLKKNDMESLWEARKAFDKEIEKAFTGSPTLQNNLKRAFRNSVQNFIADRTPDNVYKTAMREMSKLFDLKDTLLRKASSERKLSAIEKFYAENKDTINILGGLTVLGSLFGGGAKLAGAIGGDD